MARDVRGGRGCAGCTVGALRHPTGVTRTERCRRCVPERPKAASRRDRGRLTASRSPPPVGPRTRKQSPNSRVFNRPNALSRSRRTRPESLTLPIPRPHHPQRVQEAPQGCAERQGQGGEGGRQGCQGRRPARQGEIRGGAGGRTRRDAVHRQQDQQDPATQGTGRAPVPAQVPRRHAAPQVYRAVRVHRRGRGGQDGRRRLRRRPTDVQKSVRHEADVLRSQGRRREDPGHGGR